jgi:hypothetical protein
MTSVRTWRSKSGLIMFHLTMPSNLVPAAAIRRATATFLDQVALIGVAREVDVSTRSGGEYAHEWTDIVDSQDVVQRLDGYPDVTAVQIRCDLRCEDRHGGSFEIPGSLTFWVQQAEVDSPPEDPLELNLTLDTDIYVVRSWGDDRDNRELAARNAPRFNLFLTRLLRETGAAVDSVSADDYQGQVDATGILLPAP